MKWKRLSSRIRSGVSRVGVRQVPIFSWGTSRYVYRYVDSTLQQEVCTCPTAEGESLQPLQVANAQGLHDDLETAALKNENSERPDDAKNKSQKPGIFGWSAARSKSFFGYVKVHIALFERSIRARWWS